MEFLKISVKELNRYKTFLKDEKGTAVLVEAAFIYPVVITIVITLIYMGIYAYETAVLEERAREEAVMTARSISFVGYDELGDIYSGYDFIKNSGEPGLSEISRAYRKNSPYRYLTCKKADSEFAVSAEKYAENLVLPAVYTDSMVYVRRHILNREIKAEIEKRVSMPKVLEYAGVNRNHTIYVAASALTYDPAEFIRNTDITYDTVKIVSDKTGLTEKINNIKDKIKEFISKK